MRWRRPRETSRLSSILGMSASAGRELRDMLKIGDVIGLRQPKSLYSGVVSSSS